MKEPSTRRCRVQASSSTIWLLVRLFYVSQNICLVSLVLYQHLFVIAHDPSYTSQAAKCLLSYLGRRQRVTGTPRVLNGLQLGQIRCTVAFFAKCDCLVDYRTLAVSHAARYLFRPHCLPAQQTIWPDEFAGFCSL